MLGCATAGSPAEDIDSGLGTGCEVKELLSNGNFDAGADTGWIWESMYDVITPASELPVPAHSQEYAAWLGGVDTLSERLFQTVTVPVNTRDLEISGYRWIDTGESGDQAEDTLSVSLHDGAGEMLEKLVSWSNLDRDEDWTRFAEVAGESYAGKILQLQLESFNGSSLTTSFFIDTLAVQARVCP